MKTNGIKMVAACIVFASLAISSFGQTAKSTSKEKKIKVKVEKNKVPKEVTEIFYMEYPTRVYEDWYGYPAYDYADNWYYDWYDDEPYLNAEYPEIYVVEFTSDNTPHKAVYSKAGKKIAIHKKSNVTNLPMAVSSAISKGEYKTWKVGTESEEIFKDKAADQLKVYKVHVEKGKEKHTLFFQPDGKLLKDKKIS